MRPPTVSCTTATVILLTTASVLGPTACRGGSPPPVPSRTAAGAGGPATAADRLTAAAGPAAVDPGLSNDVANELYNALRRIGVTATQERNTVRFSGHTIVATTRVEQVIEQGDHATAAINVALELDGQPAEAFHVIAIGIDANRAESLQRAVREWGVGYCIPTVEALQAAGVVPGTVQASLPPDAMAPVVTYTLGPYRVFPGPTGVRGDEPEGWNSGSAEMHRAFFRVFEPALRELIPPARARGFHSLKLTLHVRNGAAGEGDCRVDGAPSDRLCQLARAYPWPAGPNEYIFKQYYVLAQPQ